MPAPTVLAANLQFPEGPVVDQDGAIILVEIERRTITRVKDGKTSILATLDGGPNGLAWGPDGALYVCNNGGFLFTKAPDGGNRVRPGTPEGYVGGWIERFDPQGANGILERRILYSRCGEHNLVGPNDLVFDSEGGFYFTDYGKFFPRHRVNGGLYYALADGSQIVEVAYPLITPNGVGLSPDGRTAYVAETETGRLWAFDLEAPGKAKRDPKSFAPHGGRILYGAGGYQRFDSLAVEAGGNICIATIVSGCITVVSPEGKLVEQVPTGDVVTTNICFGGADRKTAIITCSSGGTLIAMPWARPGLKLAYG
ncbi:SMP-30/gluconolactonase/LRE family protein [Dongia sp.]|uniref:SMP-30/gluconolactonase/LRE family protein n=1 Tax=Dongia sp. TaxID=1977262 RepID=UPI0037518187